MTKKLLTEAEILKMSDKDYMNEDQLAFFKNRLEQLQADILKNAGQTTENLRETVIVPDPADRATIEEEFDFQEGDIIAVTATPEDGWWSGELLDETRRQPGRHIFPSNFVCLF